MSNIFDLTKTTKMVETNHPVCIVVVDTNVLMNEPDPNNWELSVGPALFVISDGTILELEHIRNKPDAREKANASIHHLTDLFRKGAINEGIPIKSGWIMGIPYPKREEYDEELNRLDEIVKAFGRSDVKLFLLTKELNELFITIPVSLLTGELNLFNIAQINGVPCHLCKGFPMEVPEMTKLRSVNWEQVLEEINTKIENNFAEVDLTLTSKKLAIGRFGNDAHPTMIIAEGHGVLWNGLNHRSFIWSLLFPKMTIKDMPTVEVESYKPSIQIDFLENIPIEQQIIEAMGDKLLNFCDTSFVEGIPTLQSPETTRELFLLSQYSKDHSQAEIDQMKCAIEETDGDYVESGWIELLLDNTEDEQIALVLRSLRAMRNYWEIGQNHKFRIDPSDLNVEE